MARPTLELIINALKSKNDDTRFDAVNAIRGLGRDAKAAAGPLIEALAGASLGVYTAIASTLPEIGLDDELALSALLKGCRHWRAQVREWVLKVLCEVLKKRQEPRDPQVIALLCRALRDSHIFVAIAAVHCLKVIGLDAKAAVPALLESLNRNDERLTRQVEFALETIDPSGSERERWPHFKQERYAQDRCEMCGKAIGLLDRLFGRNSHRSCFTFEE